MMMMMVVMMMMMMALMMCSSVYVRLHIAVLVITTPCHTDDIIIIDVTPLYNVHSMAYLRN